MQQHHGLTAESQRTAAPRVRIRHGQPTRDRARSGRPMEGPGFSPAASRSHEQPGCFRRRNTLLSIPEAPQGLAIARRGRLEGNARPARTAWSLRNFLRRWWVSCEGADRRVAPGAVFPIRARNFVLHQSKKFILVQVLNTLELATEGEYREIAKVRLGVDANRLKVTGARMVWPEQKDLEVRE